MQPKKSPLAAALVSTAILLCAVDGATAAATSTSLNVSATVIASCTIAPRLIATPHAALSAGPTMCKAPGGSSIVARRPLISVEHDAAVGVTRVIFAF